jgi:hypothetical protein
MAATGLAQRAWDNGNHSFGALLATPSGDVLCEAENTVVPKGDVISHAELNLASKADTTLRPDPGSTYHATQGESYGGQDVHGAHLARPGVLFREPRTRPSHSSVPVRIEPLVACPCTLINGQSDTPATAWSPTIFLGSLCDSVGLQAPQISSSGFSSNYLARIRVAYSYSQLLPLFFVDDPCVVQDSGGKKYFSVNHHVILAIVRYRCRSLLKAQRVLRVTLLVHATILRPDLRHGWRPGARTAR